ncbi:hypothetical protein I1G86_13705 [Rhodococcus qingshengii]|nr:hypothetical protein I1G86_13705 [Rhodococcus qingshengii]
MPVSADVRERLRSYLDPDDEIRYVFPADVLMSAKPSVIVVVSRKAITVFSTSFRSRKVPRSILTQFPRMTVLGPVDTASTPHFTAAGITYEIDEEYVAVVNAADAEITSPQDFPRDPLPNL